ncbi:MAG: hypothetical protein M3Y09_02340, partial [Actinomycetota bacterium]|nr:hypothetical protein [Actinomycetota bacterium]
MIAIVRAFGASDPWTGSGDGQTSGPDSTALSRVGGSGPRHEHGPGDDEHHPQQPPDADRDVVQA